MASKDSPLKSLTALVAGFDSGAWEALASKGLLRRALKDLEGGLKIELEEKGDALQFKVPPYEVVMPSSGPAKATCNCPARGICQHILSAGLWLQRTPSSSEVESTPANKLLVPHETIEEELLSWSVESLENWAGIASVREGMRLAERGRLDRTTAGALLICFPADGIEARYMPGAGLDGIFISGASRSRQKAAAVATVLCVHLAHGRLGSDTSSQLLEEEVESPRAREAILGAVQAAVIETLTVGLAHVSESHVERFQTLAISAQTSNLPRLSRILRSLAEGSAAGVQRLGHSSNSNLLLLMARAYALTHTLKKRSSQKRPDLIGNHRTRYEEAGRLDLLGAAAYPWETPSGYVGLTVLYWEPKNQVWFSWTDARPSEQAAGFDPANRFRSAGPWEGSQSPEQSASSRLALVSARRNPDGRLSSSASTRVMVVGEASPTQFDFGQKLFSDWTELRARMSGILPIGLREMHPLDQIVVLQPRGFGPRFFDHQTQMFQWDLIDAKGSNFPLRLSYRRWTQQSIRSLESMNPSDDSNWRFIVRIVSSEMGLVAEPLTLHMLEVTSNDGIVHLGFPKIQTPNARETRPLDPILSSSMPNDPDWIEEETSQSTESAIPRVLEGFLSWAERELERVAEAGTSALDSSVIKSISNEAERLGLTVIANLLKRTRSELANSPSLILKAAYLCSLYRQSGSFAGGWVPSSFT